MIFRRFFPFSHCCSCLTSNASSDLSAFFFFVWFHLSLLLRFFLSPVLSTVLLLYLLFSLLSSLSSHPPSRSAESSEAPMTHRNPGTLVCTIEDQLEGYKSYLKAAFSTGELTNDQHNLILHLRNRYSISDETHHKILTELGWFAFNSRLIRMILFKESKLFANLT